MKELLTLILHLHFFKVSGRKCASGRLNLCTRPWTHLGRRSHTIDRNAFMTHLLSVCSRVKQRQLKASFDFLHIRVCLIVDAHLLDQASVSSWMPATSYKLQLKAQQLSWMWESCSPPDSRCKIRRAVFSFLFLHELIHGWSQRAEE